MAGLAELSAAMMVGAEKRIEVTAANVANINTPGFRANRVFAAILDARTSIPEQIAVRACEQAGALRSTGNPLDIATDGESLLVLKGGGQALATRSAQLRRDADGRLIDGQGRAIQGVDGGDVVIGSGAVSILTNGTVIVDGVPEARVGLFRPGASDGRTASGLDLNEGGQLYSGSIVPSGVDLAMEMAEMTRSGRLAETGARVFQIYDDLLGQVARKFSEGNR